MSGYYRISQITNCLNCIKNSKNLKKINDTLSKEIDTFCSKATQPRYSSDQLGKVKELNQLFSKEFSSATAKIKSGSSIVLNTGKENVNNYKNKLEKTCRLLYSFSDTVEEKKEQFKRKFQKKKHIRREAERLCLYLGKRSVLWSAAGLSLKEDTAAASASKAALNQASVVLDVASNISTFIPNSNEKFYIQGTTSVLDKDFPVPHSETAEDVRISLPTSNGLKAPANTESPDSTQAGVDPIPEPPPIPDLSAETLNQVNALGEPTFASLGLGGWTPIGMVQNCLEYLHVTLGIEWWAVIVLGTLCIRTLIFPLVILSQRNAAKMHNSLPQMQLIQMKLTEARQTGDSLSAARYSQELMLFMNEKGLNPLKNLMVPLAQAPIFISFFIGLRRMTNVPVESLTHGGLFWFTDLTLPDQYFILPIVTSLTLWLTIELGADSAKLSSQNLVVMKYIIRSMPLIILPFTINFPGAILCYWVSTNFISLGQVAILRIPKVRDYFKIDRLIHFNPDQFPSKPKGFKEGLKESWTNMKITRELDERRKLDEMQFRRAGKGPIQKTYKYDPTKQTTPGSNVPISAKKY